MVRCQIRGAALKVTPTGAENSHFVASYGAPDESLPSLALVRLGLRRLRARRPRAARRRAALRRSGSGLPIGFREARLANPLPGPCAFPIAGQGTGGGGASPFPFADGISGDPAGGATRPDQFERRKQPPAFVAPQDT